MAGYDLYFGRPSEVEDSILVLSIRLLIFSETLMRLPTNTWKTELEDRGKMADLVTDVELMLLCGT